MTEAKREAVRLNRARAGQNSSPHGQHQADTLHFMWDNNLDVPPLWIGGKMRLGQEQGQMVKYNRTRRQTILREAFYERLQWSVTLSLQSPWYWPGLLAARWRHPRSQPNCQCPTRTHGSLEEPQRGLGVPHPCLRWGESLFSEDKKGWGKEGLFLCRYHLKKSQRYSKLKGNACRQVQEDESTFSVNKKGIFHRQLTRSFSSCSKAAVHL